MFQDNWKRKFHLLPKITYFSWNESEQQNLINIVNPLLFFRSFLRCQDAFADIVHFKNLLAFIIITLMLESLLILLQSVKFYDILIHISFYDLRGAGRFAFMDD